MGASGRASRHSLDGSGGFADRQRGNLARPHAARFLRFNEQLAGWPGTSREMAERSSLRAIEPRRRKAEGERRVRFHGEEYRNAQIRDGGMGPRVSPQSKSRRAEGRHPQSDFGRNSKMPR